jgi:alpha-tubulin suppressor-like RCC1 family protein
LGDGTNTDSYVPIQVSGLNNVVAIAAGVYHTLAVTANGNIYSWGLNDHGQLGLGTSGGYQTTPQPVSSLSGVIFVSAGNHSLAVKSDGGIWSWGPNGYGQLGICTWLDTNTPVEVG